MKREWLKEMGLSEEMIDKIMSENGKDIEKQKLSGESYKKELETLKKKEESYQKELAAGKKEAALTLALLKAGAIDNDLVKAKLCAEDMEPDENGSFAKMDAKIAAVKQEYGFLFHPEETNVFVDGVVPAEGGQTPESDPFLQGLLQ